VSYASDLTLTQIIGDSPDFHGLRLRNENRHNEDLVFVDHSSRFFGVPKAELVNAVRVWLRSFNVFIDRHERLWRALRTVGAQKQATYGLLDRRGW
jgi:hypothetical protein